MGEMQRRGMLLVSGERREYLFGISFDQTYLLAGCYGLIYRTTQPRSVRTV